MNNLSWIFFANLFVSFAKWVMIILIAKLLSPKEVGIYALAFAVSAPLTLLANMKLRSLYITHDNNIISNYISVRYISSGISLILLIIIGIIIYPSMIIILILVGIAKLLDLQSEIYYSIPHKQNNLIIVGKLLLSKQFILLITFALSLFISRNLTFSLLMQIIIQIIFLIVIERKILKIFKVSTIKSSWDGVKAIAILGLPLGIVQMLISLNANFPRYMLEYIENTEILGYFSAIMYIAIVANLFMNSLSQVFLPKLSFLYQKKKILTFEKYIYKYLTLISLTIGIILIMFALCFGEEFLAVVYGPSYASYDHILFLVAISVAVNLLSWNFDTALMAMRYVSIQPKITIINFIITIVISYFLISLYGIEGAAFTLIFSSILQLLMNLYFMNKRLQSKQT